MFSHAGANAGQLGDVFALFDQLGYRYGQLYDGLGCVPIGAHTKWVLALDIQEVSIGIQDAADFDIFHALPSSVVRDTSASDGSLTRHGGCHRSTTHRPPCSAVLARRPSLLSYFLEDLRGKIYATGHWHCIDRARWGGDAEVWLAEAARSWPGSRGHCRTTPASSSKPGSPCRRGTRCHGLPPQQEVQPGDHERELDHEGEHPGRQAIQQLLAQQRAGEHTRHQQGAIQPARES